MCYLGGSQTLCMQTGIYGSSFSLDSMYADWLARRTSISFGFIIELYLSLDSLLPKLGSILAAIKIHSALQLFLNVYTGFVGGQPEERDGLDIDRPRPFGP
jgi:hypothetical protein